MSEVVCGKEIEKSSRSRSSSSSTKVVKHFKSNAIKSAAKVREENIAAELERNEDNWLAMILI